MAVELKNHCIRMWEREKSSRQEPIDKSGHWAYRLGKDFGFNAG